MRRDIDDPMCQRECRDCPLQGITPKDCPGNCLDCPYSKFCPCGNRFIYPQLVGLAYSSGHIAASQRIPIAAIHRDMLPRHPLAEYDKAMIRILGHILQLIGQPRPVVVIPLKAPCQSYRLVGGMDILLAAHALSWSQVLADVAELSQHEASVQFYRGELQRLDLLVRVPGHLRRRDGPRRGDLLLRLRRRRARLREPGADLPGGPEHLLLRVQARLRRLCPWLALRPVALRVQGGTVVGKARGPADLGSAGP